MPIEFNHERWQKRVQQSKIDLYLTLVDNLCTPSPNGKPITYWLPQPPNPKIVAAVTKRSQELRMWEQHEAEREHLMPIVDSQQERKQNVENLLQEVIKLGCSNPYYVGLARADSQR